MKTSYFSHLIVLLFVLATLASCANKGFDDQEEVDGKHFDNEIDSIVENTDNERLFDELYGFLISHPDFVANRDTMRHYSWGEGYLWKNCGEIRVYSIPWWPDHYSVYGRNIVQLKGMDGKYRLDTAFLEEEVGLMDELLTIRSREGKTYYIMKTSASTIHQGYSVWESIRAFSIKNGRLSKEKLLHAKSGNYDAIEVLCGGQRYMPLNYNEVMLICLDNFEDRIYGAPTVVIAEINENDWPTGYGLKYEWNGEWFEYVGKCHYDTDGRIRDY